MAATQEKYSTATMIGASNVAAVARCLSNIVERFPDVKRYDSFDLLTDLLTFFQDGLRRLYAQLKRREQALLTDSYIKDLERSLDTLRRALLSIQTESRPLESTPRPLPKSTLLELLATLIYTTREDKNAPMTFGR